MPQARAWHFLLLLLCIGVTLVAVTPAHALDGEPTIAEAQAAIVCDAEGSVLFEKNADVQLPPASITKIMTAMVAFDCGYDLNATLTFAETALAADAQKAGFTAGEEVSAREVMNAALVYSGNDAAINVAIAAAGSEEAFVALMNEKAAELGLSATSFVNCTGLEQEGHVSSARDLVSMGRYALKNYPYIARVVRMRSTDITVDGKARTLTTTNKLLASYNGLRGIKTGKLTGGTSLLAAAQRNGLRFYTCVLNCQSDEGRFSDTAALMDWVYAGFLEQSFATGGQLVGICNDTNSLLLRRPILVKKSAQGLTVPEGEAVSFRSVRTQPGQRFERGQTTGVSMWWQGNRQLAAAEYVAGKAQRIPCWNIFSLPLFINMEELKTL